MRKLGFVKGFLAIYLTCFICSCAADEQVSSFENRLILVKETEHGLFYSLASDESLEEMMEDLAQAFEANYDRIVQLFGYNAMEKTVFHVYTSRSEFRTVIGRDTEGTYDREDNIIKVYTPEIISSPELYKAYTDQIVHEFIHSVIQQINPIVGHVKWLDEGTAYYVSNQLKDELLWRISYHDMPTLSDLHSPTYFENAGGSAYFYSGTIVQFIVEEYGEEAMRALIQNPGEEEMEKILQESIEEFYEKWKADLLAGPA